MSVSIPAIEPRQTTRLMYWWVLSLALHAALLGVFLYVSPWQRLKAQEMRQRLAVDRHMQRAQSAALRQKIQALKEVEAEFNHLQAWREAVPPAARRAQARSLEFQRRALAAQQAALDTLARGAAEPFKGNRQRLADNFARLQAGIRQAQEETVQAQQEAKDALRQTGTILQDEARDKQDRARLAQEEAFSSWQSAAQMGQNLDGRPYWQEWFPEDESAQKKAAQVWEKARQAQTQAWESQQDAAASEQAVQQELWRRVAAVDSAPGEAADMAELFASAVVSGETIKEQFDQLQAERWAELQEQAPGQMAEPGTLAGTLAAKGAALLLDGDLADATSEQMIKAVDQAVKQAGEMLEVALGWNSSGADQGRSLTWMPRAGDSAKMLEAAQQDPKRPAKDLSAMMRDRSFGSYTTANSPDDALDTSRSVSIAPEKPTPPALNVGDLKTTPGRKIGPQGMSSGWIFIDSWYLIGPFPNLGREHMNTRFPPESLVDLDATYVGKDGRVVGWEFYQSAKAETTPPGQEEYAIYYAYTQFYVDQAMDLWISMGADDFAKVWIEDHLVWVSGRHEKAWQVNEGLRKVYFKKGPNRILVRIENGWRGMGFSILVSTEAD